MKVAPPDRHARVLDAVLIAAALLYGGVTAADHAAYPAVPDWWWPIDIGLAVLAAGALWWARQHPVAVCALLLVLGSVSVTAGLATLAGVYRLAQLRPRAAFPLTGLHIVLALPYHWVAPLPRMSQLSWVVVILLLYLLTMCFGLLSRARAQVIEGLRHAAAADRERYAAQLTTLRRDERERIAREMHDVLAHRISLLSVHAGALAYRAASASTPGHRPPTWDQVHDAATVIRENAHLAVEELREVLMVLRDEDSAATTAEPAPDARPQPRLQDVPGLVDEARRAGQHVELTIDAATVASSRASLQRTAYRIVQEGLTNARKHAPDAPVSVAIHSDDGRLHVTVTNPVALGLTSTEITGTGTGLVGLRERARLDGGVLRHGVDGGVFALAGELPTGGP